MSTFCGGKGSVPAMTTTEIMQIFPDGFLPESLPPMENGLATDVWLNQYIGSLKAQGRLPTIPSPQAIKSNGQGAPELVDPLKTYVEKENNVDKTLRNEYCFYETRYFSSLDSFLQSIADTSLGGNKDTVIQGHLNTTRVLNQKLTLITQLANAISKQRYISVKSLQSDINSVNTNLTKRQKELLAQREIFERESAAADLHKRMVEYTTEKNRANQNLLTLYGILNVTAIAMIFYIART
jgi:hypothetical protein